MKKRQRLVPILLILLILAAPFTAYADVGGNVDYSPPSIPGGGGGGGGGFGFNPFSMFYFGSSMGLSPGVMVAILIVYVVVKNRSQARPRPSAARPVSVRSEAPPVRIDDQSFALLRESDPSFSKQAFASRVSNMFVQLQKAWTDKDWKRVRPFEHDQIFHMHNEQLNRLIEIGQTNVIEEINVIDTQLERYEQDGPYEYISAILRARFKDYVVDDETGKVIKGFPDHPIVMTYRWKLMRRRGTKTPDAEVNVTQCPNCGANMSIAQNGICEYCGSEVTKGTFDWVLTQIQPLRQEN